MKQPAGEVQPAYFPSLGKEVPPFPFQQYCFLNLKTVNSQFHQYA